MSVPYHARPAAPRLWKRRTARCQRRDHRMAGTYPSEILDGLADGGRVVQSPAFGCWHCQSRVVHVRTFHRCRCSATKPIPLRVLARVLCQRPQVFAIIERCKVSRGVGMTASELTQQEQSQFLDLFAARLAPHDLGHHLCREAQNRFERLQRLVDTVERVSGTGAGHCQRKGIQAVVGRMRKAVDEPKRVAVW